ncbi:MAG: right-handed parallel beta-helix repeat-containing protein [Ardenticatenaceae bacterium]|nr:right-handed parallel beta-helix repeat-containing protein [Ardenticatenaceae bacterium]
MNREKQGYQWLLGGITAVTLLLALLYPQQTPLAHAAAIITVDGTTCTLPDAITAANSNTATGGCPAGNDTGGFDTIELQTDVTLTANLPQITSPIVFNGNGHVIDGNNLYRPFYIDIPAAGDFTLNDITVTGARANSGSALYNAQGNIIIRDSTFYNNNSNGSEGAIRNYLGNAMLIENSMIHDNTANSRGGGVYTGQSSTLVIRNSQIWNNSVSDNGGGIGIGSSSAVTITNSVITNNASQYGGGIYSLGGGQLVIKNSTIANNTADLGGGITIQNDTSISLTHSTISGNVAGYVGGGIFGNGMGNLTLNNSTISNNSADMGAGIGFNPFITVTNKTVTINNSTIAFNNAVSSGGGVSNATGYTIDLNRTILSGNTAPTAAEIDSTNGTVTGNNYNVIGSSGSANSVGFTPSGTDMIPGLPAALVLNTTLADNGGPTWTHALTNNSIAKDKAPNADCTADPIGGIDQRGAARNFDLNGSGTANECDIGAVEAHEVLTAGGNCVFGPELAGLQTFAFGSGHTVTIDVHAANGLRCLSVEEMGPPAYHLLEWYTGMTGFGLHTGNWWHITGNVTNGLDVDVTLPYGAADADSRLCRWTGEVGSAVWQCGDGVTTTFVAGTSVTQSGVSAFSDWAVGDSQAPTAVSLHSITTTHRPWANSLLGAAAVLLLLSLYHLRQRQTRRQKMGHVSSFLYKL